jgi:hypothetical protein
MKHTIITLTLAFAYLIGYADTPLSERLQYPLYVVVSDEDLPINHELKAAFDEHWSLNPVEYIAEADYEALSWSTPGCFLIYQKHQSVAEEGTTVYLEVLRVVCFTKGGKLVKNVAGVPILYNEGENRQLAITNTVRMLQDKVQFELYSEQGESEYSNYSEKINSVSSVVKLKKLYISAQDLDDNLDFASIRALYSGEVKVVDRSYIDKLIEENSSDAYYVVVNSRQTSGFTYVNTKLIIDANNGELVYQDETTNTQPRGFGKRDFKKLAD